jgi:hypothetical protein
MGMMDISGNYGSSSSKQKGSSAYSKNFWTPGQTDVSNLLGNQIMTGFAQGMDQFSTPTDYEQQALGNLKDYQSGISPDQQAAYQRAITGKGYDNIIDPSTTDALYNAIEKQTLESTLPRTTKAIAENANLSGMWNSGPAAQMEIDNRNQVVNQLATTLAQMRANDEQQRRQIALQREQNQLPAAQALDTATQNRLATGFQYGGLPRQLAGQEYNNPLDQLAQYFLQLRGQETGAGKTKNTSDTSSWNVGGKADLGSIAGAIGAMFA